MSDKVTPAVFCGELDKALAAFNLAIGAASMGMEVSMFFTFWGLNIIKRNEGSIQSKGIMRRMLNIMNRGGSKRLPLSKFHMRGLKILTGKAPDESQSSVPGNLWHVRDLFQEG